VSIPEVRSRSALLYFLEQEFAHNSPAGSNTCIQFNDNGSFGGEANLTWDGSTLAVGGSLTIAGNTTLGDASSDTITLNGVDTGTDNTVLILNGSNVIKTDEINPSVWDTSATFVEVSGTPVNDQVGIWTDANTMEGSSNLTFDGTDLTIGGDLTVTGNDIKDSGGNTQITFDGSGVSTTIAGDLFVNDYARIDALRVGTTSTDPGDGNLYVEGDTTIGGDVTLTGGGFVSALGASISGTDRSLADEWVKVAEYSAGASGASYYATAVIDVILAGHDGTAEVYQARVHLRAQTSTTSYSTCQVDIIQDAGSEAWDTTDFILTQKTTSTYGGELWVRSGATNQQCYATITNGTTTGDSWYKTDWALTPGQTWGSYASLGSDITTTNVKKRFDSLVIDDDLTVGGSTTLGDASGDSVTINAQTIDLANVDEGTDNTVLVYNGSSIVTDEIDSRVWGSTLVDGTNGTDNEIAVFTDSNSVEGDSSLTWNGTVLAATTGSFNNAAVWDQVAITGHNATRTSIENINGGYIEAKTGNATYGLIIRDYNSNGWANITTNNGLLQLGYNNNSTTAGIFLNDSDNVGIGDSSPSYRLDVNGTIRAQGAASDIIAADNFYALGMNTGTGYSMYLDTSNGRLERSTSTRKIKNNIQTYDAPCLDKILTLRPVKYELKSKPGRTELGLIAEEVYEVDPQLVIMDADYDYDEEGQIKRNVYTDEETGKTVKENEILSDNLVPTDVQYRQVTTTLIKAMQELKAENDALLLRVEQLEAV